MTGTGLRVGILISGRGSNMRALIEACARPDFPATIACVIANRADAGGLDHARAAGLPSLTIPHRDYHSREAFEEALNTALDAHGVNLICLAGFMRLLTATFTERWRDRLINIHPSLLPAFPGLDTHRQALDYGAKFSGCTVHFVRAAMDHGPIILQAAVPVHGDDTPDTLAARVLTAEHQAYPAALRMIGENRVNIFDERCFIADAAAPSVSLINPTP